MEKGRPSSGRKKTNKSINIQDGVTYIFQKILMVVVDRGLEDVGGL